MFKNQGKVDTILYYLSIVGSTGDFYNVEFYPSEYMVDTCLVRKGDVSLLKDLIK